MDLRESITTREASLQAKASQSTVLNWLETGELKGYNVGAIRGGKPIWRILPADLAEFLRRRSNAQADRQAVGAA